MLPFHVPYSSGKELQALQQAVQQQSLAAGGPQGQWVERWLEAHTSARRALLTGSCTQALELAALLCGLQPGDEVILPSFTFVTTASAFARQGARLVFVDSEPDTLNIDPERVAQAITPRTRAIVAVHYAGVACDMSALLALAEQHQLYLIEDAAHGIGAGFRGQSLGSIGHLGALSFHETKNIHCGEGGALLVNDERLLERAEILRDKGTNRRAFRQGQVPAYTWVALGSSFGMSELQAAFLSAQLRDLERVNETRRLLWNQYLRALQPLEASGQLRLPRLPEWAQHNAHLFFVQCRTEAERRDLQGYLLQEGIETAFHYQALHQSEAGQRYGFASGNLPVAEAAAGGLLRLPLYVPLPDDTSERVGGAVHAFFKQLGRG
jgi:dTDP-4-amino-4,6-dideoxygalactose transaminase